MLIAVMLIGFVVLAFQLNVLRYLLVEQIKQNGILIGLIEQLEGVDSTGLVERMQVEVDIAAGRYG